MNKNDHEAERAYGIMLILIGIAVGLLLVLILSPPAEASHTIIHPHLVGRPNSRFVPEYHVYVGINAEHPRWFTCTGTGEPRCRINGNARVGYIDRFEQTFTSSLQRHLVEQARINEVPIRLAYALIWQESGFRPSAIARESNGTRSYGLMQINNSNFGTIRSAFSTYTAERGRPLDFRCPYDNITAGLFWLRGALDSQNGDWHRALMVYNQGGGSASRSFSRGSTTSSFSRRIVAMTDMLYVQKRVMWEG